MSACRTYPFGLRKGVVALSGLVLSVELAAELKNACMHVTSSEKSHLFSLAPQLKQIVDLTAAAKMKLTASTM